MYVKDVAEKVGYKDQFISAVFFIPITGVRPSEYVENKKVGNDITKII